MFISILIGASSFPTEGNETRPAGIRTPQSFVNTYIDSEDA